MKNKKKFAIVIDWLDKYAGSERVISSMSKAFLFDEIHTMISIMNESDLRKTFNNSFSTINTTFMQSFGKNFRYFFPLFFIFVKQIKVSKGINVVISSSHSIAKNISVPKGTIHFSYFQARNMKYIWDEYKLYFKGILKLIYPLIPLMRYLDKKGAQNPNYIISNSHYVKDWVKKTYNRDSHVIYPPVDIHNFTIGTHQGDYFISVGRLEPYKRFDIIIDAFNKNNKRLIIIGDGSQMKYLKSKSNSNIQFLGFLDSEKINQYLGNAKAFVYVGIEDFGISPIEAQATGCPVICLKAGGTKETITEKTGVFFNKQTAESLNSSISKFLVKEDSFKISDIRKNAERFSEQNFIRNLSEYVSKKCG